MISQYWIGQIPGSPLVIDIKDQDGKAIDLSGYTGFAVEIKDPDNYPAMTPDFNIDSSLLAQGRVTVHFPQNYSIFTKTGEYLFRIEFSNLESIEFTSTYGMMVYEFGGEEITEHGVIA